MYAVHYVWSLYFLWICYYVYVGNKYEHCDKLSMCIVKLSQGYIALRLEISHWVIAPKSNDFHR